MNQTLENKGYVVKHQNEVVPTPCPCGSATRIITSDISPSVGFHVTHIQDSKTHFHKNTTEIYYILEGHGTLELNGDLLELKPGLTVLINPGTPHRGYGDFKAVIVSQPAFDPTDEYFPQE